MAWTWRFETADGSPVGAAGENAGTAGQAAPALPRAESFPTQSDAESWLGETWRELSAAGVDQVVLLEGGREVYGPMSLHAVD